MNVTAKLQLLGYALIALELLFVFYPFRFLDKPGQRLRWILSLWSLGTLLMVSFLWYPFLP